MYFSSSFVISFITIRLFRCFSFCFFLMTFIAIYACVFLCFFLLNVLVSSFISSFLLFHRIYFLNFSFKFQKTVQLSLSLNVSTVTSVLFVSFAHKNFHRKLLPSLQLLLSLLPLISLLSSKQKKGGCLLACVGKSILCVFSSVNRYPAALQQHSPF